MGTPTYVPPERLLNYYLEPPTYDYWSLGITFLRLSGVEPFKTDLNKQQLIDYIGVLSDSIKKQPIEQRNLTLIMIQDIFHICILKKSLGDSLTPPYSHPLLEGKLLQILESCYTFDINIPEPRLSIIRRLLSWDWNERDFRGNPHFYFNNCPFFYSGPVGDLVFCYSMSTKSKPYYLETFERQRVIFDKLFRANFIDGGIKRDREGFDDSDDAPEKNSKYFPEVPQSARDVHNSPIRIRQFAYNIPIQTLKNMLNGIFEDAVQEALSRENLFWFYVSERTLGPSRYESWRNYRAYLAQAK
jgi:serine/threonine protein kinase